jgi:hypothetical protein
VDRYQTLVDEDGVEVASIDRAHTLALEVARELLEQDQARIESWRGWRLEATDSSGVVLFTIRPDALAN